MTPKKRVYYVITSPDGSPVRDDAGEIMLFHSRESVRYNAKTRTFDKGGRYHSRGMSKDQFFRWKKKWENIPETKAETKTDNMS